MSIFWLEFRRSSFTIASPAIFTVAAIFAVSSAYPQLASWSNVTLVTLAAQSFIAPALCGAAAWNTLRAQRRRLTDLERTASITTAAIRAPQLSADMLWVIAGSVALIAAVTVRGLIVGMTGAMEPVSLFYSMLVGCLFVITGYAVGSSIPHWSAIPVAVAIPLALYALNTFGSGAVWALSMNPLYRFTFFDPYQPDSLFYVGQSLVVVGFVGLLGVLLAVIGQERSSLAIALVAIISVPLVVNGGSIMAHRGSNAVLDTGSRPLILVDPDSGLTLRTANVYEPVGKELLAVWGRIARLAAGTELAFTELEQDVDPTYLEEARGAFYRLDLNPGSPDVVSTSVETAFNDISMCPVDASTLPKEDWWLEGQLVVRTWLQGKDEFRPNVLAGDPAMNDALDGLRALPDDDAAAWFGKHTQNLLDCNWSKEDFAF
jgi:hypothetical protein